MGWMKGLVIRCRLFQLELLTCVWWMRDVCDRSRTRIRRDLTCSFQESVMPRLTKMRRNEKNEGVRALPYSMYKPKSKKYLLHSLVQALRCADCLPWRRFIIQLGSDSFLDLGNLHWELDDVQQAQTTMVLYIR